MTNPGRAGAPLAVAPRPWKKPWKRVTVKRPLRRRRGWAGIHHARTTTDKVEASLRCAGTSPAVSRRRPPSRRRRRRRGQRAKRATGRAPAHATTTPCGSMNTTTSMAKHMPKVGPTSMDAQQGLVGAGACVRRSRGRVAGSQGDIAHAHSPMVMNSPRSESRARRCRGRCSDQGADHGRFHRRLRRGRRLRGVVRPARRSIGPRPAHVLGLNDRGDQVHDRRFADAGRRKPAAACRRVTCLHATSAARGAVLRRVGPAGPLRSPAGVPR